jgi:peptidoglycan/xylan/chitin deacetylase (PgdA/CDA1 family)
MLNRTAFFRLALGSLYYSGAYFLLKERFRGIGALLTLHHVLPAQQEREFAPNRLLNVTPEFLEATIQQLRELNYDIVSLDEAHRRLVEQDFKTRFVSFTLDDGYADNFQHAFPVFRKHQVPFTIYVCTGLLDGRVDLWWQDLEDIIAREDSIRVTLDGGSQEFDTATDAAKHQAYEHVYWSLRRMPLEDQLRVVAELKSSFPSEARSPDPTRDCLSWDMIQEMLQSGLLTLGAHTVNHYALSKLSEDEIVDEIRSSTDLIEQQTGSRPRHFAYPFGDAQSAAAREFGIADELGFATSVTTRKGVIYPEHAPHLSALPRISLNGNYQQLRNVRLFMSGLPFALFNGFRKLDVA